jgi:hypothetical protein
MDVAVCDAHTVTVRQSCIPYGVFAGTGSLWQQVAWHVRLFWARRKRRGPCLVSKHKAALLADVGRAGPPSCCFVLQSPCLSPRRPWSSCSRSTRTLRLAYDLRKTPMDLNKRQQPGSQQGDAPAGPASGLVAPDAPNPLWAAIPPSETCKALCCRRGGWWVAHHLALDDYRNGPSRESLNTWGCWNAVCGGVMARAGAIRALGLAPWDMLSPPVRERFKRWTPVAQNLWESDFDDHREAMVRAWIWHYLDDNLFSFSPSAGPGELVSCASPVWEHVRLLRRDVDGKWRATTFGFTFAPPHPPSGPD